MSNIICKPKGIRLTKKDAAFEMIFEEPHYMGIAYADDTQVHIKKFRGGIDEGWNELEKLTDYSLIAFFENRRNKLIEKNIDNLCPVILGNSAYVSAGEVLKLGKKVNKQFTDVFYFKEFALDTMESMYPSVFFSYEGRWILHRLIPYTSAVAFLNPEGKFSIINPDSGFMHKEMWYFDTDCVQAKKIV